MRKIIPELLDHLPHDDPGAMRSRRDLARINQFMGNGKWILRTLPPSPLHIAEIGAGDGILLSKISKSRPGVPISAYDLAPRPPALPESVVWNRGDLFQQPLPPPGGVLIANLILHHFNDSQLAILGKWMAGFDSLILNEPLRAEIPLLLGKLAAPFINHITRHDMRVSIGAGFQSGELSAALQLESAGFRIRESSSQLGFIRIFAAK